MPSTSRLFYFFPPFIDDIPLLPFIQSVPHGPHPSTRFRPNVTLRLLDQPELALLVGVTRFFLLGNPTKQSELDASKSHEMNRTRELLK